MGGDEKKGKWRWGEMGDGISFIPKTTHRVDRRRVFPGVNAQCGIRTSTRIKSREGDSLAISPRRGGKEGRKTGCRQKEKGGSGLNEDGQIT